MATGFMAEHILKNDIKQASNGAAVMRGIVPVNDTGRRCPEHGDLLTVHGTGNGMLCLKNLGFQKGELQLCPYSEPISFS